jgi:hypothetical protein
VFDDETDCDANPPCEWFGVGMGGICLDPGGLDCGSIGNQFLCDNTEGCAWDPVAGECEED